METDKFQAALQILQRPINCLVDDDRNIRKEGLSTINKQVDKHDKTILIKLFTQTNLGKFLNRVIQDKIQANRELAINISQKFTQKISEQQSTKDYLEHLIRTLISRINSTPFAETSQQMRLKIVELLNKLVNNFSYSFVPNIVQLSNGIAKCLLDPYPDLKKASCILIQNLSKKMKFHIGHHSTQILKSLNINLQHQHSKVRKQTLQTISAILVTQSAGGNFEHVQLGLKASLGDKITDVRRASLQCTGKLINLFSPKYLKQHEATLVSYLLTGLSDQNPENVQKSMQLLKQCGMKRKDLQIQEQGQSSNQMKPQ